MDKLLTRRDVEQIVRLSRSSIYQMIAAGSFRKPLRVGRRAVRFRQSAVIQWIAERETT